MRANNLTLLTDLYELTMMQGYFKNSTDQTVVFDMFYRDNPCGGGFAICAGLEQVIEYIENLRFTDADIEYLRGLSIFEEDFLEYLRSFHFTGDIYAIPEGTVIFPREPMVKVVAPIMEAQLVETAILNIMNHQSLIATKAARVCYAAKGDGIMEFGLRRAQGPDAGIFGARAAVIGGCAGTSNVLTGQMFNVPVLGTPAHSCTLLVDTYDVLKSGVPNAIRVFEEMREEGIQLKNYGIRIDSGDLGYLSKEAKRMFTEAGFPDAIISGSNDLDEYLIQSLKEQGCTVTSWGVGTKIITADGSPSLGGVFKMSAREKDGIFEPVMKISNDVAKMTNPGIKEVRRFYKKSNGKMITDLVCLTSEPMPDGGDYTLVTESAKWRRKELKAGTYTCVEMLKPVMQKGEAVKLPTLPETIAYANEQMETLWPEYTRLLNPNIMEVNLSDALQQLKSEIIEKDLKK